MQNILMHAMGYLLYLQFGWHNMSQQSLSLLWVLWAALQTLPTPNLI